MLPEIQVNKIKQRNFNSHNDKLKFRLPSKNFEADPFNVRDTRCSDIENNASGKILVRETSKYFNSGSF